MSRYERYKQRQEQNQRDVERVFQATYDFGRGERIDTGVMLVAVTVIMEHDLLRNFPKEAVLDLSKRHKEFMQRHPPSTSITVESVRTEKVISTADQLSNVWEALKVSPGVAATAMYNMVRRLWISEYGEQIAQEWQRMIVDWSNQWGE
jgi:hypothetical protein